MKPPDQNPAVELRAAPDRTPPPVELRPITHQPIVAVSLVLIAATLAQIAVYMVNARLLASAADIILVPPSSLIAGPQVFQAISIVITQANVFDVPDARWAFGILLVVTMLSTVGWYAAAHHLLGPGWAVWGGIFWALHPLFGFLAQRPGPLTLGLVFVPAAWALLLWWNRSRRRRIAFLAGVTAGATAFVSPANGVAFLLVVPLLFVTGRMDRRPIQSFVLIWVGYALPLVTAAVFADRSPFITPRVALEIDLLRALESDQSPLARAVPGGSRHTLSALPDLRAAWSQSLSDAPLDWLKWVAGRAWRTLYATADGHFQRPLFAVQVAGLVPAIWGVLTCLRVSRWRWPALASVVLIATHWIVAAVAEPLARSLAPVGGLLVLFAIVGIADVYERAFGRRLDAPDVA